MKYLFVTFIIMVVSQIVAQDFAPIGATWYYTERFAFSGDIGYLKIESVKDTLVQGKKCKLLSKTGVLQCSNRVDTEIVYNQDSAVYFWDKDFGKFQMLYDFKAVKDSSWTILIKGMDNSSDTIKVVVDSITNSNISNRNVKVLNVSYYVSYYKSEYPFHYSSKIVYSIGDYTYLFNFQPYWSRACDFNYSEGLRCYEDAEFGYYSTGIADSCTYTHKWTSIERNGDSDLKVNITPNPTQGKIRISCIVNSNFEIFLLDNLGKIIRTEVFRKETNLDISSYAKGIYFVLIYNEKGILHKTKMIKK